MFYDSVRVVAGLTNFGLFEEAANNIEWSFDGLTKSRSMTTRTTFPSSLMHCDRPARSHSDLSIYPHYF